MDEDVQPAHRLDGTIDRVHAESLAGQVLGDLLNSEAIRAEISFGLQQAIRPCVGYDDLRPRFEKSACAGATEAADTCDKNTGTGQTEFHRWSLTSQIGTIAAEIPTKFASSLAAAKLASQYVADIDIGFIDTQLILQRTSLAATDEADRRIRRAGAMAAAVPAASATSTA